MVTFSNFVDRVYILRIIVIYLMIANSTPSHSVSTTNVCSTDVCKISARKISSKMDDTVSPCDDFYGFVCGKYIKNNSPTPTPLDLYEEMRNKSQFMLISLFENNNLSKAKPFQQISRLYQLCIDQSILIKQGAQPLWEIMDQFGGWPLLEGTRWNETGTDWVSVTGKLIKLGFSFDLFLRFSIIDNPRMTPNLRIISLDKPKIQYDLNQNSTTNVYYFYNDSVKNAIKLGATRANAENALRESQQLLIDLIKMVSRVQSNTRVMSLSDLSSRWPSINWTLYFSNILSISSTKPIDNADFFTVDDTYIDELVGFINKITPRVLLNYVLSRVIDDSLLYLRIENIVHSVSTRKELCVSMVSELLPNIVDAMFAFYYVEDDKRRETIAMMATITEQFVKIIQQTEWLDNLTKINMVEKLSSMITVVGYPEEWKTTEWMNLYSNLELKGSTFLHCVLDVIRFKKRFQFETGQSHVEDGPRLAQINRMPYYRFYENKIVVSAGFLQYLLVDQNHPKYMNYATMGFFIGHEITHSFDGVDELIRINKKLGQSSKDKFLNESSCIIHQYNNYKVEEINLKLNGYLGARENIADNVGVKLAYMAYMNWASQNEIEPALFNLNYTPAQLFWINMASPWCTKIHPDILRDLVNDKHSPARFRVIGAVSNNVNFSKDFNCPVGSKMNPTRKCTIW